MVNKLFSFLLVFTVLNSNSQSNKYDSKFSYINESGEKLFDIECKYAYNFSNGLARISKYTIVGDKAYYNYGYINTKGEIVIPCLYEYAYDFNSTATFVKKRGATEFELIDKKGNLLTQKKFTTVGYFFEGMCAIYENDAMGFIDSTGNITIQPKYTGAGYFAEGLVCVCPFSSQVAAYGFVDKNDKVIIPLSYKQAGFSSFQKGEARMQIAGKTVLINKKNEVVFRCKQTTFAGFASNGLAAVGTKPDRTGWGLINRKGEYKVQPIYTHIDEGQDGNRIMVELKGKHGVIDTTGKIIIPIKYFNIYGGDESGFYAVQNSDDQFDKTYLDMDGKEFLKTKVKYLYGAEGSKLIPFRDPVTELEGYVDRSGNIAIKPTFKKVSPFAEGMAPVEYVK